MGNAIWEATKDLLYWLVSFVFARPEDAAAHPVNWDAIEVKPPKVSAPDKLKITALAWLGRDASPANRAPQELSCAEGVVNLINKTWPGTLSDTIIGTDQLYLALKKSKRFTWELDPIPGSVIVYPKVGEVHGHALICTRILLNGTAIFASNDSRTGKFEENYTRETARQEFIHNRGLKGYIFEPVELSA